MGQGGAHVIFDTANTRTLFEGFRFVAENPGFSAMNRNPSNSVLVFAVSKITRVPP